MSAVLARACPTCGGPAAERFRPFCSKRCADLDLARWLKGLYVVPGAPATDDDAEDPAEAAPPGPPARTP